MDVLGRYEALIEDFEAFRAACERPLPHVVRVNTIKATPGRVVDALDEEGVGHERLAWNDHFLELDTDAPGITWPYFHGWIHGQEAVSALPVLALDPVPGSRVWDACAAPGSKTSQLAAAMDDRGRIVANDSNLGRLAPLRSNLERLGVTNVAVTNGDARNFSLKPFGFDRFDAALVDAPCSGEGTVRKNPSALADWSEEFLDGIANTQRDILRRAVEATKPDGRVVYSTCTYAPEENEAVLDAALDTGDCRLLDVDCPLDARPGVIEWRGERFHESVRKARRIYPHLNDTGGFFYAALEVTG